MMGEGDDCAQTSSSDNGDSEDGDDDPYHNDRSSRITFRKGKRRREREREREKEGQKADEKASHVCGVRFWPAEEGEMERGDL